MRLGIVSESLDPNFIGGGHEHLWNVVNYLKEYYDLTYYPSLRTLADKSFPELAKSIEDKGIEVASGAFQLSKGLAQKSPYEKYYALFATDRYYKATAKKYAEERADFYYDPNYYGIDANFVAKAAEKGYGITVHGPYFSLSLSYDVKNFAASARPALLSTCAARALFTRVAYNNVLKVPREKLKLPFKNPNLKFVAAVSQGTLEEHNLLNKGVPTSVLRPANAFNKKLFDFRSGEKEDYLVFYARLVFEKGLLHVPEVLRLIAREKPETKLVFFGPPGKGYQGCALSLFWKKVEKYGLKNNVQYLGVLPRDELYRVVSRARALIYPTFSDAFSLVLLEALALGTPAVSYGVPGIKSVFGELPAVKIVDVGDVKGMARGALELLNGDESAIQSEKVEAFLREHSDWAKVGEGVKGMLEKYAKA
ncbi:MAG: glycosyltransferase [Thermoprotei archaeon]